jgi:hypothetical protein
MYKCDFCGKTSEPHEKLNLIIAGKRLKKYWKKTCNLCEKFYTYDLKIDNCPICSSSINKIPLRIYLEGEGWEIVEQKKSCGKCLERREIKT